MVALKFSVMLVMVVLVKCEPPVPSYGTPLGNPINNYNNQNYHDHDGQDPDHSEPKSYEFGYAVKDDYSGNDYKRRETSDGNQVNGEYRVNLPDGRTQIVTYYADWQTGFHADVRYEGTASYPETYGNGNNYQNNQYGQNNNLNNQYGVPNNNQVNNQYGAPNNNQLNNQYGAPNNQHSGFGNGATSSVMIKDFSGPSQAYNTNSNYNSGYGNNQNFGNNFDSYAGNFGSRTKPSTNYGAP